MSEGNEKAYAEALLTSAKGFGVGITDMSPRNGDPNIFIYYLEHAKGVGIPDIEVAKALQAFQKEVKLRPQDLACRMLRSAAHQGKLGLVIMKARPYASLAL